MSCCSQRACSCRMSASTESPEDMANDSVRLSIARQLASTRYRVPPSTSAHLTSRVMRRFDRLPVERRLDQSAQFGPKGFESRFRSDKEEHSRAFVEWQSSKVSVGLILGQTRPELRLHEYAFLALPVVNQPNRAARAFRR